MKFVKRAQRWVTSMRRRLYARAGIEMPLTSPQRETLEKTIIPFYASRPDIRRVLFVGCDYYTSHYWKFFPDHEFWTLEPDPKKKAFGSSHHVVDALENLHRHFPPDFFDLILCNGVFGWGLNSRHQCEIGFENCYTRLRQGGELLIGWNDLPKYTPVRLESIKSLTRFQPQPHSPFSARRHEVGSADRHIFDFYVK